MTKVFQVGNILRLLKVLTYISATVLLLIDNEFSKLTYLIPLVILLVFTDYFRDYCLIPNKKPASYIAASIVLELLLIICTGFFDKSGINILFFFVLVSWNVIIYPFTYSLPVAVVFIASELFIYAQGHGSGTLKEPILPMFFSYGISTTFVMGMSYFVKLQMREKEKLAHINSELEQAYKKLIENSAAAHQLTIEEERTRMAREIHDTLAHTLTTLIVQLEACKRLASLDPSRLPAELEKAQELSRSGFNDIKRSIKALRPQAMENKSLFASINSVICETMENTKVNIAFNNLLAPDIKFSSQVEVTLFRAIQESITNSIRHGQASEIEITIKQENNTLQLCIADNGRGCSNIKKGYGMQGISERIESLNGNVAFSSSFGKGFKTILTIPCEVA